MIEPIAASASHMSCVASDGGAACRVLDAAARGSLPSSVAARDEFHAVATQTTTNAAYNIDQLHPSCGSESCGSNSTGKPSNAVSDARLERANNRYGTTLRNRCQYQACNSGVVVESRKYGRPIVAVRSNRMRRMGASSPC